MFLTCLFYQEVHIARRNDLGRALYDQTLAA